MRSGCWYPIGMIRVSDAIQLAEREVEISYASASGPGGQNVNRVATAAHLRFNAADSPSLPDDVKRRLRSVAGKRLTPDGVLIIKAQRFRTRERNREDALDRLVSLIARAEHSPRSRRPTQPSPQSIERRLDEKRRRGRAKQSRGGAVDDDEE